jgi:hypothetical protein
MLTDAQHDFLKAEARLTGLSAAELVRRALDAQYRATDRTRIRGWDVRFGVWQRPDAAVVGRRRVLG